MHGGRSGQWVGRVSDSVTRQFYRTLTDERIQLRDGTAHLKVWRLSRPMHPGHNFKYRLVYLEGERVRVLYDVHTGKPDHKHIDGDQLPYAFKDLQTLATDFFSDIEELPK